MIKVNEENIYSSESPTFRKLHYYTNQRTKYCVFRENLFAQYQQKGFDKEAIEHDNIIHFIRVSSSLNHFLSRCFGKYLAAKKGFTFRI